MTHPPSPAAPLPDRPEARSQSRNGANRGPRVGYLVNQYPKVSHSFIRREILALEACGLEVQRFSLRSMAGQVVDPADEAEVARTRCILAGGATGLLAGLLRAAIARPVAWGRALALAVRVGRRSDRGLLRHLAYFAEACILWRWTQDAAIDRLHAHFGTNSATVVMLCRVLGGCPYSFTVHGPEEFDRAAGLALREKIERASFVAAVSSFGRSQLYRLCDRRDWEKIQLVRCGLDADFLQAPSRPVPDTAELVCVGRLCEQKGQLLLLDAVRQLVAAGSPVRLTLVGDGEMRPDLEAAIARDGLGDRVTITGWASSDRVRDYIQAARALVLPSFAEGLPVVLMEALALGRPVVSTYIAGIPELVRPGINGWLVPAGSVADLAEALQAVLACPVDRLEAMGRAGQEITRARHDALTEARKLAAAFRDAPWPEVERARLGTGDPSGDRPSEAAAP